MIYWYLLCRQSPQKTRCHEARQAFQAIRVRKMWFSLWQTMALLELGLRAESPVTHSAAHWECELNSSRAENIVSVRTMKSDCIWDAYVTHTRSPNREYSLLFSSAGLSEAGEVMSTINSWRLVPCSSNSNWSVRTSQIAQVRPKS